MLLLIVFIFLFPYFLFKLITKTRTLPPGPLPVPILGNMLQIAYGMYKGKSVVDTMKERHEKYGPVYTFWLGPLSVVNICDLSIAQETMVKKGNMFADRTVPFILNVTRKGLGVIASNGQHWSEQRRFALHSLRNFGLGRGIMEERIMLEVDYRCEILDKEIAKSDGKLTFDPQHLLDITIGNVINRMLFTERFTEDREKKFFHLKHKMDSVIERTSFRDLMLNSWTAKLPLFKDRVDSFLVPLEEMKDFFREQVAQKRSAIAAGEYELKGDGEDFVDAFLIQMAKSEENGAEDSFNDESLIITLLDLWVAGQETTATTLYWALTYLLLNKEVLRKLEDELLEVTGSNRSLTLNDRTTTPYLNAVITETLRMSSIVPINLWRNTLEDTQVGDFVIPKGTAITAQLSVIMADGKTFEEPQKFNPSRFLDGDDRTDNHVISFGLGKRACLGESLARAELYLVLGNLVRRYKISPCADAMPCMKESTRSKTVRKAVPYKMIIQARN